MYSNSRTSFSNGIIYTNNIRISATGDGNIKYKFYFTDKYRYSAIGNATNAVSIDLLNVPENNINNLIIGSNPCKQCHTFYFKGLTKNVSIRIYSASGSLVKTIEETDGDGKYEWDMKNEYRQSLASGVYIAHTTNPQGEELFEKIMIIR